MSFIKPAPPIASPIVAPPAAPTPEYGEYLAWHASGCAECHTPRDPKTAKVDPTRPLAGGLFPFPEPGFTTTGSNLTPDAATGLGGWTEEQFVTAVQTGVRPNGTVMLPFMPWPAYASWSRDDLHAVWLYLRSLPPVSHRVPVSTLGEAAATGRGHARGRAIYDVYCLTCHGEKGAGSPFTTVPLRDAIRGLDAAAVGGFITDGLPGTAMPPFGKTLSREQIADLAAFIRAW